MYFKTNHFWVGVHQGRRPIVGLFVFFLVSSTTDFWQPSGKWRAQCCHAMNFLPWFSSSAKKKKVKIKHKQRERHRLNMVQEVSLQCLEETTQPQREPDEEGTAINSLEVQDFRGGLWKWWSPPSASRLVSTCLICESSSPHQLLWIVTVFIRRHLPLKLRCWFVSFCYAFELANNQHLAPFPLNKINRGSHHPGFRF